jgi:hypothetical protein
MTSGIPGIPGPDALQPLGAEVAALVRQELERIPREYLGQARRGRTGLRMVAGATVLGSMAAGSVTALAIRLLERRPAAAPATTAAVFGAASAALAAAGRARLRRAWSPVPD